MDPIIQIDRHFTIVRSLRQQTRDAFSTEYPIFNTQHLDSLFTINQYSVEPVIRSFRIATNKLVG
jgi:hypothetical protein